MKKQDFVSIWLGNSTSLEAARNFVFMKYSEDGDLLPSEFCKNFQISRIDPDFTEIAYKGKPSEVREVLDGISYEEQLIHRIITDSQDKLIEKITLGILLYNFEYDHNNVLEFENTELSIKYIGSYKYIS